MSYDIVHLYIFSSLFPQGNPILDTLCILSHVFVNTGMIIELKKINTIRSYSPNGLLNQFGLIKKTLHTHILSGTVLNARNTNKYIL